MLGLTHHHTERRIMPPARLEKLAIRLEQMAVKCAQYERQTMSTQKYTIELIAADDTVHCRE